MLVALEETGNIAPVRGTFLEERPDRKKIGWNASILGLNDFFSNLCTNFFLGQMG